MIIWSKKLYFGKGVEKNSRKIMKRIEKHKLTKDIYCITFASNKDNLFDIVKASEFKFPHYEKVDIHIVGLSKGKEEAEDLLKTMIEEVYRETDGFAVRDYFI